LGIIGTVVFTGGMSFLPPNSIKAPKGKAHTGGNVTLCNSNDTSSTVLYNTVLVTTECQILTTPIICTLYMNWYI